MADPLAELAARIAARTARVGVVGLGYVGLPLARAFSKAGFPVLGYDTDPARVEKLLAGRSYLGTVPDADVATLRAAEFDPTSRLDRLGEADALLICVPTPLTEDREPDLRFVVNAAHAVAAQLRPGQLVVLESTTYPTTTRTELLPVLERTGLRAGRDFALAYSPEREDPGNPAGSVHAVPKVVGGLGERCGDLACSLYAAVAPSVIRVSSPEVAEAAKVLENTYRAVNIALVNELKVLYDRMGIDVWEVIAAAKTKPFGFQPFYPGPGLGGHCIPVDPFYLSWVARRYGTATRFVELAGEVNAAMPGYVVGKLADALNDRGRPVKGSRVLVLGVAYKKDVDDTRESPGLAVIDLLERKGAAVAYHDPHVPRLPGRGMESALLTAEVLADQDAVVVVTDHTATDWRLVVAHAPLVIDTRDATRGVRGGRATVIAA